ncbi:putative EF-hand domain pair protein CML [Helianthus anomalus]
MGEIAHYEINNCEGLLKSLQASVHSLLTRYSVSWNKLITTTPTSPDRKDTIKKEFVTLEEINMVMAQLGFQQCCGYDANIDIVSMFDDEEPSLSEVKMAFDVFDENSDGFIDEFEFQRMMFKFGQLEMAKLEECRNMIKGFDINGDGVIDFNDFVRLMESCSF